MTPEETIASAEQEAINLAVKAAPEELLAEPEDAGRTVPGVRAQHRPHEREGRGRG
jgi:hypothetical protein